MGHGESLLHDGCGLFRQVKFAELFFPRKSQIRDVASGSWFAADEFTEIVSDDVVVARFLPVLRGSSAIFKVDAVKELNQFKDANFEPGFLS